jgi:hypothetical protein|tara:strand:- start:901 stop:1299 length:399 start_codon:yes stop_codon:yes gene_type:complete
MVYTIDVSLDIKKSGDLTIQKVNIKQYAETNNCVRYYGTHEIGGINRTITRNHYVMTFCFQTQNDIINFIKIVKNKTHFKIEMVGFDDCIYIIIYASKIYLKFMEREMVIKYRQNKPTIKEGIYKDILKQFI